MKEYRDNKTYTLFGWDYTIVNKSKFPTGIVFFSHTKPANSTSSRPNNEQAQPNEHAVGLCDTDRSQTIIIAIGDQFIFKMNRS